MKTFVTIYIIYTIIYLLYTKVAARENLMFLSLNCNDC